VRLGHLQEEVARMSAYLIVQMTVSDPERYKQYLAPARASVEEAGGRYLVRGGEFSVLEGDGAPERTVIVEFPDRETAVNWYNGPAYEAARAIREGAAEVSMYVLDGTD
jgi:uncharacterized protein (DUF1330 family)